MTFRFMEQRRDDRPRDDGHVVGRSCHSWIYAAEIRFISESRPAFMVVGVSESRREDSREQTAGKGVEEVLRSMNKGNCPSATLLHNHSLRQLHTCPNRGSNEQRSSSLHSFREAPFKGAPKGLEQC